MELLCTQHSNPVNNVDIHNNIHEGENIRKIKCVLAPHAKCLSWPITQLGMGGSTDSA